MTTTVSPEDAEFWGEDLVRATQRWTEPVVRSHVSQLQQQLGQLSTELNQQRVQTALDNNPELRGSWRTINDSKDFLQWLEVVDPLSNEQRLELLRRAYRLGDTARCAAFFHAFIAERIPKRSRTMERKPFEAGKRQPTVTTRDLGDRRRVWTRSEIAAFYNNCRKGLYDGREAERLRIENEIVKAGSERRVSGVPPKMYGDR